MEEKKNKDGEEELKRGEGAREVILCSAIEEREEEEAEKMRMSRKERKWSPGTQIPCFWICGSNRS